MSIQLTSEQAHSEDLIADPAFCQWYVDDILSLQFPHFLDLGARQCIDQTRNALLFARHFGIHRRDLQGQFLSLMWGLGPNFHEHPAFNRILSSDLGEADKIDRLFEVSDREGGEAALAADDRYWYPWLVEGNRLGLTENPLYADWDDDDG